MSATPQRCLGLLSGTSADGVDAALITISGAGEHARLTLTAFATYPYPAALRQELFALFAQTAPVLPRLCVLDTLIGEAFAIAAQHLCDAAGVPLQALMVIGSHGQTVWHQPTPDPSLPLTAAGTLQIGSPAVIAQRTGVPVIADFRSADIAAGGQGAPLVPYFDWVVFRHPTVHRAVQNLGGIANVTYVPAGAGRDDVLAFDTGPGNMLIDGVVQLLTDDAQAYDRDGQLAARGRVLPELLAFLLDDPYFQLPPPKTTGREAYGRERCRAILEHVGLRPGALRPGAEPKTVELQRACDLLATLVALTAESIAEAYRRWLGPVDEVIVGGGGTRNPVLMAALARALAPARVVPHETYGIDSKAKEAMAFALLAHDALLGLPTNMPRATGARQAVTLGSLTPPRLGAPP